MGDEVKNGMRRVLKKLSGRWNNTTTQIFQEQLALSVYVFCAIITRHACLTNVWYGVRVGLIFPCGSYPKELYIPRNFIPGDKADA